MAQAQKQSKSISEETEAPKAKAVPEFKRTERVFRGQQKLIHDLFKLKPAKMKRDHGYNPADPMMVEVEHSHIFHTVDSNGRTQNACSMIAGHFHYIEVTADKDGAPRLKISEPKKWVMKKQAGKKKPIRVAVDVTFGVDDATITDRHTHEYEYRGSQEIVLRKMNVEAVKLEAAIAAVHNPSVEGVVEG